MKTHTNETILWQWNGLVCHEEVWIIHGSRISIPFCQLTCIITWPQKKINNDYIKYDHYTTSTTTRYNYNPNVLFVRTIRTISFTYSYTLINMLHGKCNHFPRNQTVQQTSQGSSFSSISLWSYRGDLFTWKIFLQDPENCQLWLAVQGSDVRDGYTRTVYMWLLAQMLW